MAYRYETRVRQQETLRASFNQLTKATFGFDFSKWYADGHWTDLYQPHVLLDGGKVVSNVSANWMRFRLAGGERTYLQLGTVMTDQAYRGQGLNRQLMERVLAEYRDRCDGVYLFGNDSVLDYYPKFGFVPCEEYEHYLPCQGLTAPPYPAVRLDMTDAAARQRLWDHIAALEENPGDALYMSENLGLYQFWLGAHAEVYALPGQNAFAAIRWEGAVLHLVQVFAPCVLDARRLACSFGGGARELVFDYTPAGTDGLSVREYKEEDCTLFILGGDLHRLARERMRFPALSHA